MTHHVISTDDLSDAELDRIISEAISKDDNNASKKFLAALIFFEPSTRTRLSFAAAALKVGGFTYELDIEKSSQKKGENEIDTVKATENAGVDFIILRHYRSGAAKFFASQLKKSVLINGGDGCLEHPTQALADATTIIKKRQHISDLNILFCGDLLRSRTAHSSAKLLKRMGAKIFTVSPRTLSCKEINCNSHYFSIHAAPLEEMDVIISARLRKEKGENIFPDSEFSASCKIDKSVTRRLKKDALIMSPGPVIPGLDFASEVFDDGRFVVDLQAEYGHWVRSALFRILT